MEISPEKGCRILSFAQHTRPLSRERPLSCHTCYDTEYLGFCGEDGAILIWVLMDIKTLETSNKKILNTFFS